jgi:predicted ATP-dependent serine protease
MEIKSKKLEDISIESEPTILTGNEKLDKWFSSDGGIVKGTSIFMTGTPGAGKTTFLMYLIKILKDQTIYLYERETLMSKVRVQTANLNVVNKNAFFADKNDVKNFNEFLKEIDEIKPSIVMVDSLQAIADEDFPELSGVEARILVLNTLRKWCEDNNSTLILIGHNTKDGEFAGENKIMQYCDAHIEMVFNQESGERIMSWGIKNRKGPMGKLFYEITETNFEIYDENEWKIKKINKNTNNLELGLYNFLETYFKFLNKKNIHYDDFVKEYKNQEKKIRKRHSTDSFEYIHELLNLTYYLKNKYKI